MVAFNNRNFYTFNGVYYSKVNNVYEVIEPEIGTVINQLPNNYKKIQINGIRAYEVVSTILLN